MQVRNLKRLKSQGLADRCTAVVDSGRLSEEMSYLLLQPVGKQLNQDEDAMAIMKVLLLTLVSLPTCCRRPYPNTCNSR